MNVPDLNSSEFDYGICNFCGCSSDEPVCRSCEIESWEECPTEE